MKFYKQANIVDQEKMKIFYMHNFVLTNMEIWDPNPTMGDMQLMALASWMVNEDTRAKEIGKVMGRRIMVFTPLGKLPHFFLKK